MQHLDLQSQQPSGRDPHPVGPTDRGEMRRIIAPFVAVALALTAAPAVPVAGLAGVGGPAASFSTAGPRAAPVRVAYQGEPGAYSEKSLRELLGNNVVAVGRENFEECYRAVASRECDYCCLPVENSLGGSIHENYDLMLRYDLTIVAEHEFRVKHCLLAKPGMRRQDIMYAISHPQALAQCDNYLRGLGIKPIPTYDTAGSAKMLRDASKKLPEGCTPENTAAIASDLAGETYGMNRLESGIEDDDTNFTRFLKQEAVAPLFFICFVPTRHPMDIVQVCRTRHALAVTRHSIFPRPSHRPTSLCYASPWISHELLRR